MNHFIQRKYSCTFAGHEIELPCVQLTNEDADGYCWIHLERLPPVVNLVSLELVKFASLK